MVLIADGWILNFKFMLFKLTTNESKKAKYKATWSVISISAESDGLLLPKQSDKEGERIKVGRRLIFSKSDVTEVLACN